MGKDLVPTVLTADEAYHVGTLVHGSGLFGDITKAEQAAIKVMAGAELGLGPIASTRGVDIIKGEVSLSAGLCAALVKRSDKYDYRIARWDDEACEIVFYEHGEALNPPIKFDKSDAQRADLIRPNRDGSPGAYQKYPRNMYFARAMTNGARLHCPDLFAGSVYTSEELGVVDAVIEAPAAAALEGTAATDAVTPAPVSPPEPAPALPPEPVDAAPAPEPEPAPARPEPDTATTPAQIMELKGFGAATQRMMLIEVGVDDVGDLDAAYASLTDEQQDKLIAMAQARA